MESLSPECTPLKHRYDSCFNSWFEGYLQPALDADQARTNVTQDYTPPIQAPPTSRPIDESVAEAGPSKPPTHRRIVTNWSSAFPSRNPPNDTPSRPVTLDVQRVDKSVAEPSIAAIEVDTRGKSRSQVKAEEYERRCGDAWRGYQTCLKSAIHKNQSLSALLEQAREEHPLRDQGGLKGTVWDADYAPED